MKTVPIISIAATTLVAGAIIIGWQHAKISSLEAERAAFEAQKDQTATPQPTQPTAVEQASATPTSASSTDMDELLRLRAQVSRLRQLEEENALLKNELQRGTGRTSPNLAGAPRTQPQAAAAVPDAKPVSSTADSTDLGPIEFTEGTPKRFDLGDGRTCTVNPVLLLNDKLTIEVKIDSADSKDPTVFRVVAHPDKQVGVWDSNGKLITLTPTVKRQ